VAVTGATGFVGSHLVEALVEAGADVRALVRYNSDHRIGNLAHLLPVIRDSISITRGDLRDFGAIFSVVRGADMVFHLGALGSVPYSYRDPVAFVEVNVGGTCNVLQASREAGVDRVVLMSTSEVYGTARYVPIDEQHPLQAQSPYAASKVGAEKLAESFRHAFETPVVIVRAFNIYGPRQTVRNVIPSLLHQAVRGSLIKVGYLDSVRDYTFVTDTIRALLLLATEKDPCQGVFNIASGVGSSVSDLVREASELLGKRLEVTVEDSRLRPESSEVRHQVGASDRLRELTGWRPLVSMRSGLERVLGWTRSHCVDSYAAAV
jgi:dTDP-glucose 4,6-dehydratase